MIAARNIHKSYGNLPVLKGLDLQVKAGQIASIVGASGAGKSTLLHLIGTLDKADSGSVSIGGQELNELQGNALASFRNKHIGFVFQFHHLLPEFTALENVCIPAYMAGTDPDEAKKRGSELLDLLGMASRATHKPGELSGGELQRAAVARSLINKPDVVLADEPSGNLDSRNAQALHDLFIQLRDTMGQTFVIVTHNKELAAMADQSLEIADGVIVQ
jgi:lipoprotein-releasing system ATP-binding protein